MTRVFGLHEIELNPGVKEEDFENFFRDEVANAPFYPGWRAQLLKGERGARKGKYLMLMDIESEEARDRFAPTPDQGSEETNQFNEQHKEELEPVYQKWATFSPTLLGENSVYTDYLVLDE
jgi:hypothetical protein